MGLKRLRGRLDQVQGAANLTLQDARDLVADLQDGIGITIHVDANAVKTLMDMFLAGKECKLPLTIKIDPTVDTKE
jgi:hypothetical protein